MTSSAYSRQAERFAVAGRAPAAESAHQGYLLLRIGFAVAPILFGLDKFANVLVDWEECLAPWITGVIPAGASNAVHLVGIVEILAGVGIAIKPRYAPYLLAAWLGGMVINLLTGSPIRDIIASPSATSAQARDTKDVRR